VTVTRVLGILGRLGLLVVVGVAGGNMFLSLSRWEWQRALMAGLFALAGLVVLCTLVVLRRAASIEARLDALAVVGTGGGPATRDAAGTEPGLPFAWLTPPPGSTAVFMPILLGFGLGLSAAAVAVERIVTYVIGGTPRPSAQPRPGGGLGSAVAVLAMVLAVTIGLGLLAARLVTRPETHTPGERVYVLDVQGRRGLLEREQVTSELVGYCAESVDEPLLLVRSVEPESTGLMRVVVTPVLGTFKARAFQGCLTDLTMDRVRVAVRSVQPPISSGRR